MGRSTSAAALTLAMFFVTAGGYAQAGAENVIPGRITAATKVSGDLILEGTVVVEKTGVLVVAPGSRILARPSAGISVQGRLEIAGSSSDPVKIAPAKGEKWEGISFASGSSGTIRNARISGAAAAVLVIASQVDLKESAFVDNEKGLVLSRESVSIVESTRFESNEVGIAAEMKSRSRIFMCSFKRNKIGIGVASGALPKISGNRFGHNRIGIRVYQRYPETISGNLFVENDVGITFYQNGPDTVLERNLFINSGSSAVIAEFFSSPRIINNRIKGGRFGIFASQFSSPVIENNFLTGTSEAIHLNKKSMAAITRNVLSRSGVGVFCDFSSYPDLKNNFFDSNKLHLKLGRFQSSHWEKEAGSGKLTLANATRMNSRNPRLAEGPGKIPDHVDASQNWWDEKTSSEMDTVGPDGNVSSLFDGYDLPEVTYEGFGDATYRLDRIIYLPRLGKTVDGVGLRGWKGSESELEVP